MSLAQLNPPQRAAIRYLDGPLLVLAGAGSGKTRVITQKIAYLIREGGFSARNIAAITFTNKAAREMLERVGKLLSADELRGLTVSTFHSLGLMMLRQEAQHVATSRAFPSSTAPTPPRSSPTSCTPPARTKSGGYRGRFRAGKTTSWLPSRP